MFTAVNRTLSGMLGKIQGDRTDIPQPTDGQTDSLVSWVAAGAGGGGSLPIFVIVCIVIYRNLDAASQLIQSCQGLIR